MAGEKRFEEHRPHRGDNGVAGKPITNQKDSETVTLEQKRLASRAFRVTSPGDSSFELTDKGSCVATSGDVPGKDMVLSAKTSVFPRFGGDQSFKEQSSGIANVEANRSAGASMQEVFDKVKHTFQLAEQFSERQVAQLNGKANLIKDQFHDKPDTTQAAPGWTNVDMRTDAPPVNQELQDMPINGYNCKYYLKTYIEGHKPYEKNPSNCEIDKGYMEQHGYHKEALRNFQDLKDGDVVMVKAPNDGNVHIFPVEHVAIVQRDAQGNIFLIQKTDDIHPVQRCSLQSFVNHFGVKIPGPQIDVYTH